MINVLAYGIRTTWRQSATKGTSFRNYKTSDTLPNAENALQQQ
jgi:hypothetical protein